MAKKANRRNQGNPNAEILARHRGPMPEDALRQTLELHRSGASGAHADSKVTRDRAAGRTNRVGSRSMATKAAIKDTL